MGVCNHCSLHSTAASEKSFVVKAEGKRLHFAFGKDYQGSVRRYNKFIALIFCIFLPMRQYRFDGKKYWLNKKSFKKFVNSLGEVCTYKKELTIHNPRHDLGLMREHLSVSKRNKLFRKMVKAFQSKNTNEGIKLLHKGAEVNEHFWVSRRNGKAVISFGNLPLRRRRDEKIVQLTPILAAALGRNQDFQIYDRAFHWLQYFGASMHLQGQEYSYPNWHNIGFNPTEQVERVE